MLSKLLDIVAPQATASIECNLNCSFKDFTTNLDAEFEPKEKSEGLAVYRVKGDFFSDLEATQIVFGKPANPSHYSKNGFNLKVIAKADNIVKLEACERAVLGYFEIKAFGIALQSNLKSLVENYT